MKKTSKRLFGILGGILALVLVLAIVAWVMIDSLAKRAVEDGGQYALGVPTKVESVNLSLLGGTFKMNTLNVGNPDGYKTPHLMQTGQFHLAVRPSSVLTDTVVVPTFELDGLDVNIEAKGLTNNIQAILDHVKKLGGDSSQTQQPAAKPAKAEDSSGGKKVRVDKVIVRNVVAHVTLGIPGAPLVVRVPSIELDNVSSDKGITVDQLISRLIPAIFASIFESGKGIIPADLLASLNSDLAGAVGALGGQAAQLVQQGLAQGGAQVQQALQQAGQQAGQALDQTAKQAQGALDQAGKSAVGGIQNIVNGVTAPKEAGEPEKKEGVGKAIEGLFKK